jgi:hypothetical protein
MVLTLALTQIPIHTLTRPAATLSHPMGEGQERAFHVPCGFGNTRDGVGQTIPSRAWGKHPMAPGRFSVLSFGHA